MSSSIVYNGSIVNAAVSDIHKISDEFFSLSKNIKIASNKIISARGFQEYIGGITSDTFSGYVGQCGSAISELTQLIRQKQIDILAYTQDKKEINVFLDSLNRTDYNGLDLSGIESYISFDRKASNVLKGIGASIASFGAGLVEGILDFGETGADLITLGGTLFASMITKPLDWITGSDVTTAMWEETKAKVSEKKVESIFDSFYSDTKIGQAIKNNAYGFEMTRGIGKGLGYTAGMIGVNIVTGGLASGAGIGAAGSISAGQLAATAGVMGFSNGTEEAWADGASIEKGLTYGVASGAWEGLQWYLGAKINQYGGLGDRISQGIFKGAYNGVGTRIAMDTIDSGLEGFVQPALTMIYKDYGGANIVENYQTAFEQSGGWQNVLSNAAMGGIASAFGEFTGARKLLKESKEADSARRILASELEGMEGVEGAGLLSAVAGGDEAARRIFSASGDDLFDAPSGSYSRTRTIDGHGVRIEDTAFNTRTGKNIPNNYQWFSDGSYLPSSIASLDTLDSTARGLFKNFEQNLTPPEVLNIIEKNRMNLSAADYTALKTATTIIGDSGYRMNLNELKLITFHSEGNIGRIKSVLAMSYANVPEDALDSIANKLAKNLFPTNLSSASGLKRIIMDDYISALQRNGLDDWKSATNILRDIDSDRIIRAVSNESRSSILDNVKNYFGGQLSNDTAIKLATCDGYPNTIRKILLDDGAIPDYMVNDLSTGVASKIFSNKNLARLKATVEADNLNITKALQLTSLNGASFEGYSDLLRATNLFSEKSTRNVYYSIIDELVAEGASYKDATKQARLMNGNALSSLGRTAPSFKVSAGDVFTTKDMMYLWDDSIFSSFDNTGSRIYSSDYMNRRYITANHRIDGDAIVRDFRKLMTSQYDNMDVTVASNSKLNLEYSKKATDLFMTAYIDAASDMSNPNRGEALKFMSKILELNENGTKIMVVSNGRTGSYCNKSSINLAIATADGNLVDTVFHENGHYVFGNVLNANYPDNFDSIRSRAVSIFESMSASGALDSYEKNLKEVNYYVSYLADKEFKSNLQRAGFSNIEDYRQALIRRYSNTTVDNRSSALQYRTTRNGALTVDTFERQLSNKLDFKNAEACADIDLAQARSKIQDRIFRTDFTEYAKISSIIDSTTMGQQRYGYGHGQTYFEVRPNPLLGSYHELMADYSSLKVSGDNVTIKYLRSILGDELFDTIDKTYQQMLK